MDSAITGLKDTPASIIVTPEVFSPSDSSLFAVILNQPAPAGGVTVRVTFSDEDGTAVVLNPATLGDVNFNAGQLLAWAQVPTAVKNIGGEFDLTATIAGQVTLSGLRVQASFVRSAFFDLSVEVADTFTQTVRPQAKLGVMLERHTATRGQATSYILRLAEPVGSETSVQVKFKPLNGGGQPIPSNDAGVPEIIPAGSLGITLQVPNGVITVPGAYKLVAKQQGNKAQDILVVTP